MTLIERMHDFAGLSTFNANYLKSWKLDDLFRFMDGVHKLEQERQIKPYFQAWAFNKFEAAGMTITPDLPSRLFGQAHSMQPFIANFLGGFLTKNGNRYAPKSLADMQKIQNLWKAFGLLQNEDDFRGFIDLSTVWRHVSPRDAARLIIQSSDASLTCQSDTLAAFKPLYEGINSQNITLGEIGDFRRVLDNLSLLKVFHDVDARYEKYSDYLGSILQHYSVETLVGLTKQLGVDDFEQINTLIEKAESRNSTLSFDLLNAYMENTHVKALNLKDLTSIEKTRDDLNQGDKVMGTNTSLCWDGNSSTATPLQLRICRSIMTPSKYGWR